MPEDAAAQLRSKRHKDSLEYRQAGYRQHGVKNRTRAGEKKAKAAAEEKPKK